MAEFKVNDKVKYDDPYSAFTWYGTVAKVNRKTLMIRSQNGSIEKVEKRLVNFD
jgi:hypothetical protein